MNFINPTSLYKTLDNLNQSICDKRTLSPSEKNQIAKWITGRQGLKGSYANMFAPTENDFKGMRLFTGDRLTSKASISHILGEEALRALYVLNVKDKSLNEKIKAAKEGIDEVVQRNFKMGNFTEGTYCCGKCTAAYWRNLSAEGVSKNKEALEAGIKYLKSLRDGKGKWKRFPFFYTLIALYDINLPSASEELKYASEICRKYISRKADRDIYGIRRKQIAEKILALL